MGVRGVNKLYANPVICTKHITSVTEVTTCCRIAIHHDVGLCSFRVQPFPLIGCILTIHHPSLEHRRGVCRKPVTTLHPSFTGTSSPLSSHHLGCRAWASQVILAGQLAAIVAQVASPYMLEHRTPPRSYKPPCRALSRYVKSACNG